MQLIIILHFCSGLLSTVKSGWRSSSYYFCRCFPYIMKQLNIVHRILFICSGLLKLSTVYSGKRLAVIEDLPEAARVSEHEHNIYALWKIILGRYLNMSMCREQGYTCYQNISRYPAENLDCIVYIRLFSSCI